MHVGKSQNKGIEIELQMLVQLQVMIDLPIISFINGLILK